MALTAWLSIVSDDLGDATAVFIVVAGAIAGNRLHVIASGVGQRRSHIRTDAGNGGSLIATGGGRRRSLIGTIAGHGGSFIPTSLMESVVLLVADMG